jgi:Alginate export
MARCGRLFAALFACAASLGIRAALAAEDSCAVKPFRWQEDCRNLREREASLGVLERLRYLPLNASGTVWLTLGGEYRLKTEYFNAPDFFLRPTFERYTAVGERFLLHADLRTAQGLRVFVQLSAATEAGRRPAYFPFDRTRPDIAQAFVDVPLHDTTVLRMGRQELDSGGNRLISTRDAGNLRLSFDMAHLESHISGFDAVAFYGRPVLNQRGAFDDRGNPAEKFLGGWVQHAVGNGAAPMISVFFLSRDRDRAVYEQGVAADDRRTVGLRASGAAPRWDYALQVSHQYGSFGSADISADGVAGDVGWHPAIFGHPRIAASFGYASGDSGPRDHRLETFDVLYPNLGYFTDAPVFYPGNTVDFQPNVTFEVVPPLRLRAGSDIIHRLSKHDAVYTTPGVPLIPGTGSGSSYVTALSYLRGDWALRPGSTVTLSYVHGDAGSLIRSAAGHPFSYLAFSLDLRL